MADYSDLDPTVLRASVSDGTNLKPSITTSNYSGGTPSAANEIKRSISYADGTLKQSIADSVGLKASWLIAGSARPPGGGGGSGLLAQVVTAEVGKVTTTGTIPSDDTRPQNTEGGELITATITPTDASSKIIITLSGYFTNSVNTYNTAVALFKDSDASAIAVSRYTTTVGQFVFDHWEVDAGDTSARTYKIRFGANGSSTSRNYQAAGDDEGGLTNLTTLTLMEVLP